MFVLTRRVCEWTVGAMMPGLFATTAFAEGAVLANPDSDTAEVAAAAEMPAIIPGVDNADLAFVAVMLMLLGGLIWIWIRGGSMQRQAQLNEAILNRAQSRRSVVMDDDQLAAAEARDKADRDSEVQEMVAGRIGLRSPE